MKPVWMSTTRLLQTRRQLFVSPHLPTHRLAIEVFSLDRKNGKQVAFLSELIYQGFIFVLFCFQGILFNLVVWIWATGAGLSQARSTVGKQFAVQITSVQDAGATSK